LLIEVFQVADEYPDKGKQEAITTRINVERARAKCRTPLARGAALIRALELFAPISC
jgi:hypothetical protein